MPAFGQNPFPRRFGGGRRAFVDELSALLVALEPGWDPATSTESYNELYAYALALGTAWATNRRLRAQMIPATMLEALPTWEEVLRVPPAREDTLQTRRARVAAKLLGIASNAVVDIEAASEAMAGTAFVELRAPNLADVYQYWPGVNPGPPGNEWCSNIATIVVVVQQSSLTNAEFFTLLENLAQMLDLMIPAWANFAIGTDTGTGFVLSVGTLGITFL